MGARTDQNPGHDLAAYGEMIPGPRILGGGGKLRGHLRKRKGKEKRDSERQTFSIKMKVPAALDLERRGSSRGKKKTWSSDHPDFVSPPQTEERRGNALKG